MEPFNTGSPCGTPKDFSSQTNTEGSCLYISANVEALLLR